MRKEAVYALREIGNTGSQYRHFLRRLCPNTHQKQSQGQSIRGQRVVPPTSWFSKRAGRVRWRDYFLLNTPKKESSYTADEYQATDSSLIQSFYPCKRLMRLFGFAVIRQAGNSLWVGFPEMPGRNKFFPIIEPKGRIERIEELAVN
jgi:hypothetical protein